MSASVCLSVCQDISGTTRAISTSFSVHVAYGRLTKSQAEWAVFLKGAFFPMTMHCNAFAAKGISREWIE